MSSWGQANDMRTCPICLEDYSESGDKVPRLLPCSHTVCQIYTGQLIQNSVVQCPECRERHRADSGIRSFPQNKYIIAHLKKLFPPSNNHEENINFLKCEEHGKDAMLFCRNEECGKEVCPVCLVKYHKTHDIVGLDEYHREKAKVTFATVDKIIADLNNFILNMQKAKSTGEQQRVECIAKINENREAHLKKVHGEYGALANDVDDCAGEMFSVINNEISVMEENQRLVISMKENVGTLGVASCKELETLENIAIQIKEKLSNPRSFVYNDYELGEGSGNPCGNLHKKTLRVTSTGFTMAERNQRTEGTSSRIPCEGLLDAVCANPGADPRFSAVEALKSYSQRNPRSQGLVRSRGGEGGEHTLSRPFLSLTAYVPFQWNSPRQTTKP